MFLNEKKIKKSLKTDIIGKELFFLETVDSTNRYARKLIKNGFGEGVVIIADKQTKGRGRFGRKWYSPSGMGVWMSIILSPINSEDLIVVTNYICALSIVEAIYDLILLKGEIKWPNDILISKKKVGGILSEFVKIEREKGLIIAGLGININQDYEDFPIDLQEIATSLNIECGCKLSREEVIVSVLRFLEKNYLSAKSKGVDFIFKKWISWCTTIGKKIRVITSEKYFEGIAETIKPEGKLIIRNNEGKMKEITPSDIIQVIEYKNFNK
jgi:BirA family biotin operon repressor/biotin-[acetyl-CoA-carboxylase] ligase